MTASVGGSPSRWRRATLAVGGLVAFHLALSVVLSLSAPPLPAPELADATGLRAFAPDSFTYHRDALRLSVHLRDGDVATWWSGSRWWHVKWIALSYALLTPSPLAFAPINALTWVASVAFVFLSVRSLFPERDKLAIGSALVFGLWPSHLLHSTQLLKDPLFVMGVTMAFWGCVLLLRERTLRRALLPVVVGTLVAVATRPYALAPLTGLTLMAAALGTKWRGGAWRRPAIVVALTLGFGAFGLLSRADTGQHPSPGWGDSVAATDRAAERAVPPRPDDDASSGAAALTAGVAEIAVRRETFATRYPGAGSNIDTDVRFNSLGALLGHLPRATMIGYLAPFPSQWFGAARTAGRASRILAGLEMSAWYLLLVGFVAFVIKGPVPSRSRVWLLLFTVTLVVLTSLVVTNVGALYRLRYVYLLPVLIGGVERWTQVCAARWQLQSRRTS